MKKHELIYIELLKLRTSFISSKESINKCIKYNENFQESKHYYEGQYLILDCVVKEITYLIKNIESGVVYEND